MKARRKFRFRFKSIYLKFAVIFLGIWWGLNAITFASIMRILSSNIDPHKLEYLGKLTGFVFLNSAFFGTIIILWVVRSVVKPIKNLSSASRKVAKGNFDISVDVKTKDEVGRLTDDFNRMVNELKGMNTLRKDFVANVSHEFRTPITVIRGYAVLINKAEPINDNIKEFSKVIITESERLIELSTNLLRLSELDNQHIHKRSVFSVDEQIRQIVVFLEPSWGQKNLDFELNLETVNFYGDEDLLHQVWFNLIQNAIKFSFDGGNILIQLQKIDGKIRITIKDNGIGISSEAKSRIFERFFKGSTSTGNGLGLSIVNKIIEQSGGKIMIESELNEGTEIIVELPEGS